MTRHMERSAKCILKEKSKIHIRGMMLFLWNKILNVYPPSPPLHIHVSMQGDTFNFSFWNITKGILNSGWKVWDVSGDKAEDSAFSS